VPIINSYIHSQQRNIYQTFNLQPKLSTLKSVIYEIDVTDPFNCTSDSIDHLVSRPFSFFNLPSPLPTNSVSSLSARLNTPLLLTLIFITIITKLIYCFPDQLFTGIAALKI
jgi:hypothetical protein